MHGDAPHGIHPVRQTQEKKVTALPRNADPRPLTQKARVRTGSILDLAVKFTKKEFFEAPSIEHLFGEAAHLAQ